MKFILFALVFSFGAQAGFDQKNVLIEADVNSVDLTKKLVEKKAWITFRTEVNKTSPWYCSDHSLKSKNYRVAGNKIKLPYLKSKPLVMGLELKSKVVSPGHVVFFGNPEELLKAKTAKEIKDMITLKKNQLKMLKEMKKVAKYWMAQIVIPFHQAKLKTQIFFLESLPVSQVAQKIVTTCEYKIETVGFKIGKGYAADKYFTNHIRHDEKSTQKDFVFQGMGNLEATKGNLNPDKKTKELRLTVIFKD
jgi:hypothetical protein